MIREERTEISYANKKKAAKPTFGKEEICIKIFIQQSDTEAGGAIGLSSHRKVHFCFFREDEHEKCPIKLGQIHLLLRPT